MQWVSYIPHINAALNIVSISLIVAGYSYIRKQQIAQHRTCMVAATIVSAVFLVLYLTGFFLTGSTSFAGEGIARTLYLVFLSIHELLALLTLPLVIMTLMRGFRGEYGRHRRIARYTAPIWLYVMASGFIIYLILHH